MKLLIVFFSFLVFKGVNAQDIKIQAVSSSGISSAGQNVSLLYTVGEITVPMSTGQIGSGFISGGNPVKIITAIHEPKKGTLNIKFFPNPVHDILSVDLTSELSGYLNWRIIDITGKTISNDRYSSSVNRIAFNTNKWSSGTYIVNITSDSGDLLGSYQIIKQ